MGALRVLLVEDEHLIRLMAGQFLRDEGFDVEEASSGDEAALRLVGPELFDVLFTDVQMPGKMDGIHARPRSSQPARRYRRRN
jgi:CheY-like chemotaxis protein